MRAVVLSVILCCAGASSVKAELTSSVEPCTRKILTCVDEGQEYDVVLYVCDAPRKPSDKSMRPICAGLWSRAEDADVLLWLCSQAK